MDDRIVLKESVHQCFLVHGIANIFSEACDLVLGIQFINPALTSVSLLVLAGLCWPSKDVVLK